MKYHVIVLSYDNENYRHVITKEPVSKPKAERIDDGANINLDHERYYTVLEEVR